MWMRSTNPKALCAGCRDIQDAARERHQQKIPKARRAVWQIIDRRTGQVVAYCGPCKAEFGNGTTR